MSQPHRFSWVPGSCGMLSHAFHCSPSPRRGVFVSVYMCVLMCTRVVCVYAYMGVCMGVVCVCVCVHPCGRRMDIWCLPQLISPLFINFYYICMCLCAHAHTFFSHVAARGQLSEICSLPPSCGTQGLDSGHQACWQVSSSEPPTHFLKEGLIELGAHQMSRLAGQ